MGTPLPLTPRLGVTALRSALLLLNAHQASDIESVPAGIPQRGNEVVKQHFIHHYLFFFSSSKNDQQQPPPPRVQNENFPFLY